MTIYHTLEDVGYVCLRFDVVKLCRFDQRANDGPAFCAGIASCKQVVLSSQSNGADCPLDRIGVEFDASILKEAGECGLARQGVADRLCKSPFRRDAGELDLKPDSHLSDERRR